MNKKQLTLRRLTPAFTLMELMIVVGIIALLCSLAIPSYGGYQARARQTEAAVMLASLHSAQMAYFAQHGKFSTALQGPDSIGWKPQGYRGGGSQEDFYYTYGFNVPNAQEGIHYVTGKLNTPKESLGATTVTDKSFTVGAAGALVSQDKSDVWHINQDKRLSHVVNGIE